MDPEQEAVKELDDKIVLPATCFHGYISESKSIGLSSALTAALCVCVCFVVVVVSGDYVVGCQVRTARLEQFLEKRELV